MNKKILFLSTSILIYQCAQNMNEHYNRLMSLPKSQIIKSLKDAVQTSDAVNLEIGDTMVSSITESDPVVALGKEITFRSNCKLYRFHAHENEVYTVEIISTSDSTHPDKNILFPIFILADKEGNVIRQNKMAVYETLSSNLSKAFSIYCSREIYISAEDDYFLLVASDNSSYSGNSITTMYNDLALKYKIPGVAGKRHPWGRFRLILNQ